MMDFINNNYVWLIIILIIVLLAIIGYIAEKQGFGVDTKEKNNNEKKDNNIKPLINEQIEDAKKDDLLKSENEGNSVSVKDTEEDLYAPFGDQEFKMDEKGNDISDNIVEEDNIDAPEAVTLENLPLDEDPFDNVDENKDVKENNVSNNAAEEDNVDAPEAVTLENLPLDEDPFDDIEKDSKMDEDLFAAFDEKESNGKEEKLEDEDIWKF